MLKEWNQIHNFILGLWELLWFHLITVPVPQHCVANRVPVSGQRVKCNLYYETASVSIHRELRNWIGIFSIACPRKKKLKKPYRQNSQFWNVLAKLSGLLLGYNSQLFVKISFWGLSQRFFIFFQQWVFPRSVLNFETSYVYLSWKQLPPEWTEATGFWFSCIKLSTWI